MNFFSRREMRVKTSMRNACQVGWKSLSKAALLSFFALLLSLTAVKAFGQASTGSITGQVMDGSRGLIADATVTIRNTENNAEVVLRTDSSGLYTASSLQPGTYSVSIAKKGFATTLIENVAVNIAATATVDSTLKVGEVTATVTVQAQEQLIDRSSSTTSVDVPMEVSENLPLPERSAMEAVMLSPGVQGDPQYNMGVQSENPGIFTQPTTPGGSLAVGGGRPGSALQLVDGVDLSMVGYPRVGITFSGDDLQQITVQSNGVPAKFGRAGGGVINQASRGGSLVYHGIAKWRHMDPFFEATTYGQGTLNVSTPSGTIAVPVTQNVHQNLFTGLLSGPVPFGFLKMNKNTFFLASYEPLRGGSKIFSRSRVPTPAELSGDFSNSYTLLNASILSTSGYAAAVAAPRVGGLTYQFPLNAQGFPNGAKYSSSAQYVPIANYNLSAQLAQNAFAKYVLSQFPKPGSQGQGTAYLSYFYPDASYASDGNNAQAARGVVNTDNRYNVRIDQNLGASDHAFFRFTSVPVRGVRYTFLGPESVLANQPLSDVASLNALLDYTHVFHGSALNDVHYSYMQMNYQVQPAPGSVTQDFGAKYGLTPSQVGVGFPLLAIDTGSYGSSTGGNDGGVSNNKVFHVGDDFSFVVRSHSISLGGEWRALQLDRLPNAGIYGGNYNFSAGTTNNGSAGGNATASFILGSINTLTLAAPQKFYYRYKYVGAYLMDSWRVNSKLTLNYGLRYSLEFPRTEKYGLQGSFLPNITGTLNGVAATGGFAFSGQNGLPTTLYPVNYKGFEPRVGFAYAATPAVVVRGSFGLIHAPMTGVTNSNIPALTPSSLTIGGASGGTNPANWVNYITNPVALPSTGVPGVLTGPSPFFSYGTGLLPWVSQANSVPYTESWSVGVQYQYSKRGVLMAAYSGNQAHHLFSPLTDTNILPLSTILSEIQSGFNFSATTTTSIYGTAVPKGNANINLVPYPQFSNNTVDAAYVRESSSSYNGLFLNGVQRLPGGVTLISSFTWAKSMDDGSSGSLDGIATDIFGFSYPQSPFTRAGERSYSTYDIPTHVTAAYSWDLPFGKKARFNLHNAVLNGVFGGLHTSGIFNAQSGYPAWATLGTVGYFFSTATTAGSKYGSNGNAIATGSGHYNLRPNIVPGVPLVQANWRKDPYNLTGAGGYLNPAAFTVPGSPGNPQFGNAPRTLGVRSPHTIYFDMSAKKDIPLKGEKLRMTVAADAINVFNHTNFFLNPNSNHNISSSLNSTTGAYVANPNFGILSSANNNPGRSFALSATVQF